jgi:pectin methylesterase-like acyl-CoA thioesterase
VAVLVGGGGVATVQMASQAATLPPSGGAYQVPAPGSWTGIPDWWAGAPGWWNAPPPTPSATQSEQPAATPTTNPAATPTTNPGATPTTNPGNGGQTTVAADGSGKYRTVQEAVDAVPTGSTSPVTITIKPGTYRERVTIPASKPFVTLQGTGSSPKDVVIVRNVSVGQAGNHLSSATVVAAGHDFTATNLTMSNDYTESASKEGQQALALYLDSDRSVLRNVRLVGDQDTFLVHDNARSYITDSYIEGTVDFIYGGGTAVLDGCTIYEKRTSGGPITAARTDPGKTYGFLIYRSTINGATNGTVQLGRPWRQGAQVLYRESTLSEALATAQPWINMGDATWQKARFFEYKNTGPGATVNSNRPQMSDSQAANYTPQKYLAGSDGWNPMTSGAAGASR